MNDQAIRVAAQQASNDAARSTLKAFGFSPSLWDADNPGTLRAVALTDKQTIAADVAMQVAHATFKAITDEARELRRL